MSRRSWQDVCRNPLEGHEFKAIPVVEYRPKTETFPHVRVINKRCKVCGYIKAICIASNGRRKTFYKPSTLPDGWRYEKGTTPAMLDYADWLEEDLRAAAQKQRQKLRSVA